MKNTALVAIFFGIATFVVSCGNNKYNGRKLDLNVAPRQVVNDMSAVQTKNGHLVMRMSSPLMQRFKNDSTGIGYELFTGGFDVYAYDDSGLLETKIHSEKAKHVTSGKTEKWEAYGHVVVTNFIKGETMVTDTLYWNREKKKIFTPCFVKMYAPDGFMQGYGMESDEMARNAYILHPFNSYGIVRDSTEKPYVDTVNFIGPVYRRSGQK